jgi:hypothetical protein
MDFAVFKVLDSVSQERPVGNGKNDEFKSVVHNATTSPCIVKAEMSGTE